MIRLPKRKISLLEQDLKMGQELCSAMSANTNQHLVVRRNVSVISDMLITEWAVAY